MLWLRTFHEPEAMATLALSWFDLAVFFHQGGQWDQFTCILVAEPYPLLRNKWSPSEWLEFQDGGVNAFHAISYFSGAVLSAGYLIHMLCISLFFLLYFRPEPLFISLQQLELVLSSFSPFERGKCEHSVANFWYNSCQVKKIVINTVPVALQLHGCSYNLSSFNGSTNKIVYLTMHPPKRYPFLVKAVLMNLLL
ncbi:hypothetical protein VNO77_21692 [Canavalia gladiata]|uniref:Uncharacterized protein n=1 Tax=Canavalia gladiata TaxID=3824 RepID=A0AAN9LWM8_CANGL